MAGDARFPTAPTPPMPGRTTGAGRTIPGVPPAVPGAGQVGTASTGPYAPGQSDARFAGPLATMMAPPNTAGMVSGMAHSPTGMGTTTSPSAPAPDDSKGGGTESGRTYIEDRYLSRANGTDPGWEYATGKGTDAINKNFAARGGYNSSGAMNQISDMFANATSQREKQLDDLAAGATSGHQNALNGMFATGGNIAGGVTAAGVPGAKGAGDAMSQAQQNQINLRLHQMGYDDQAIAAMKKDGKDLALIAGL